MSARIPRASRRLLERAALSGATVDQFVMQAALREAKALIDRERTIALTEADARVFFRALENPPAPNARLRKAAAAYRKTALRARD
jgi:uncharacterized protein (DUF1778 family)